MLLYGAADTSTPKKSKPAPSTKSKAVSKSKTSSKSKTTGKSKAAGNSKSTGKSQTSKSPAHHSTTAKSGKSKSKVAGKRGKATHSASDATWRSRQLNPTPDRYKEIQSALVERGYLTKDASGVWDADSADALRRFQHDQSLDATGKLNSLSLIALGLGPKHPAPAPAPVAAPTAPVAIPTAPSTTPTSPAASPALPPAPAAQSPEALKD